MTTETSQTARIRPKFLTEYAPTRYRKRLTPFSRVPITGRIGEVWHLAAQRHPRNPVIVDRAPDVDREGPLERSYLQWAALVDDLASRLHALGVREWDRVAVVKRNHLDVALLASAAARIGAVPALITDHHDARTLAVMLGRLEKPFLVTDRQALERMGLDKETVAELTEKTAVVDDAPEDRPDVVSFDGLRGGAVVEPRLRAWEEPMVITHTSGTTGVPKLVLHSAESLYSLGLVEAERWPFFRLRDDDTVAFCEPYSHQRIITGLLPLATVAPKLVMMSDPLSPVVRELLVEHKPTLVETLPNAFLAWEELAQDPAKPFQNVRVFVNSFDAIHTRTVRTFLAATGRKLPVWVQSWSQTEAGAVAIRPYVRGSVKRRGHRPPPTQVLGWPVPGFGKVRAVDPDTGIPVRRGEVGLIQFSAPGRCLTYVGEQERHDLKREGNWWNLGDMAVINRIGAVRLIDREVDRIPGASALEIEDVLLDRLPRTTEVIILAVAGGKPQPVYSSQFDQPVTEAQWRAATADLPEMAEPIHIRWDEFPRTATWKVRRVMLREQLLKDADGIGYGTWT
ncbi:class I adenylate-forming enzyme family protein [Streptomyces huiliensis]|uniref:class I adenylate-forming enzyme family protein n=1 Tax=Streptomyces huiliensis TaxID=2876027 RepID=UPI001CBA6DAA|nr:class I adenylate-forming enzyme family protein [Streptomyces huiliensis]MBZ4322779.1 acyl--CoA ligase [Streptomyces huiliensis]